MSKVGIKLNMPGINAVMKSAGVKSALKAAGDAVASAAGSDYVAESPRDINWISIVNVYPDSKEAARDNYENNSLIKAISAVGLPMSKGGR